MFPRVARELHAWRARAATIPDARLRRLALSTLADERGNLEGAAAFAVLAPRARRAQVVRASVAFQLAYDFLDTLAEDREPACADPLADGRQLHLALLSALDPSVEHADYYAHHPRRRDGGYVRALTDACAGALAQLPSFAVVTEPALRAARRMIAYQSLNHTASGAPHRLLARWASELTPPGTGLRWWETAAGAASSLTVFALIATAASPGADRAAAAALERAYFPWIGALHVLLDSIADHGADMASGQHSLVDHYASPAEAATRLQAIAQRATRATRELPGSARHAVILAAMAGFYLSQPAADGVGSSPVGQRVLHAMGTLAAPTMLVLRARRAAFALLSRPAGSAPVAPARADVARRRAA